MQDIKKIKYYTDVILDAFSLERSVKDCSLLNELMHSEVVLSEADTIFLEKKREILAFEGEFWNEEELKMQFLAHLFDITNINEPNKIKTFYERPLADTLNGYKLSVVCDMLLATPLGVGSPKNPYFFLQEFKKAKNALDAEGQMLVAMLIAQHQNANGKPVYGCWLQGRYWIFTVLHQNKYCLSRSFDASNKHDLMKIVGILTQLKKTILEKLID